MARSGTGIRDCGGRIMGIGGLISPNPHNPSTTIPNPGPPPDHEFIILFYFYFFFLI
jgi:hypothetical protein